MFTRQQMMDKECTHQQYWEQFVTRGVIEWVKTAIGIDALVASTDPHFNDIPLYKWDNFYNSPEFAGPISRSLQACGDVNARSFGNACCVAKTAAYELLKAYKEATTAAQDLIEAHRRERDPEFPEDEPEDALDAQPFDAMAER